jgi:hypothetical protein
MAVRKATLKVSNAGDGLSEALSIEPKAYHIGDEVHLVLKGTITKVEHRREKDEDNDLIRLHNLKALEVAEVSESDIRSFLADAAERAKQARDAAKGQEALPGVLPRPGVVKGTLTVEGDGDDE